MHIIYLYSGECKYFMPSIYINTWYKEIYWYLLKISCSCNVQLKICGDHFQAYNVSCFQGNLGAAAKAGGTTRLQGCGAERTQAEWSVRKALSGGASIRRIRRVFLGSHSSTRSWECGCTKVKPSRRELSGLHLWLQTLTLPPWKLGVYVMCSRHSLQLGSGCSVALSQGSWEDNTMIFWGK